MSALRRLGGRITNALGIGRQTADTVETGGTATLQGALPGGVLRDGMPHVQLFGFCSRPVPGSDVVVVFQNGDPGQPVVIATGHQPSRPKDLQPGEVCVLHPLAGSRIWLKNDGSIALLPANGKVSLAGDLDLSGTLTAAEAVIASVAHSSHEHPNGNGGANTGQPIAG